MLEHNMCISEQDFIAAEFYLFGYTMLPLFLVIINSLNSIIGASAYCTVVFVSCMC